MNNLKKYPSYKDSEIDSLGQVPGHWTQLKINHFTQVVSQKGHQNEELLSVYRDYGVILKNSRTDNHNKDGEDLSSYKLVKPGYLVLNKMKTWQGSLGVSNFRGIVSPAYITCKVKGDFFDNNYLHYLLRSEKYIFQYNRISYGVRVDQWDMRYDDFKNLIVYAPPFPEQTAIANFLDKKTTEIKEFITLKEKTIELLKERKMAIINQAVTKGLVPTVEMKNSGIEWLGEIPKHWEVNTIKRISKLYGRIGFRGYQTSDLVDEQSGAITLSPSNMKELGMDYSHCTYLSWNKYFESPEIQIKNEDILFVKTGSTYGKVAFVENLPKEATINPQILVFKEIKINKLFFYYFLSSGIIKEQVELGVIGGTIPTLSQTKIGNFYLSIPPLQEQIQIITEIQTKSKEINEVIKLNQLEIVRIKEYQQSLISEVVTGKVDVSSKNTRKAEVN